MNMFNTLIKSITKAAPAVIVSVLIVGGITYAAGSLTAPTGVPEDTSYTLEDIYTKLTTNADATEGSGTIPTTPDPVALDFYSLNDLYEAIPTIDATKVATGTSYLGVSGTMFPSQLLTTGIALCYDASGVTISCTDTGQDGFYQNGVAKSYTDNGDETISDNKTGLMWKKCSQGLSGNDCSVGTITTMLWVAATTTCEVDETATYQDWRLPNLLELLSLVDFSKTSSPFIDVTYFPATYTFTYYWTSTSKADFLGRAWGVNFGSLGQIAGNTKGSNNFPVRCVRNI